MDLKEEAILGDGVARHWYYRAKSEALDRVVGPPPATVLDVGAGSGFFSRHLLEHGAGQAVCVDPGYAEDTDTEHAGRPLLFRRAAPRTPSDLILMMDVLEHVDDDTALAADYIRSAQSGARVIVTVPAFAWMWSEHDDFLEHRRRYTLPGVQAVLRRAGLRVDGGRYLYGLLLPLAAATRLPGKIARRLGSTAPPGSQMRPVGGPGKHRAAGSLPVGSVAAAQPGGGPDGDGVGNRAVAGPLNGGASIGRATDEMPCKRTYTLPA